MATKTTKQTKKRASVSKSQLKSRPKFNVKIAVLLTIVIAGIGAYFLFFASAAIGNCQKDGTIDVCDVDMIAGDQDTIIGQDSEVTILTNQNWGVNYSTNFRAPKGPLRGAVPITRIVNVDYTWHDWVTDAQKKDKEAKYGGTKRNEGVVFYAWAGPGEKGAVPVYRLTRGGSHSQSIFSVDKAWVDRILATDANNPDGWKSGTTMPAIAFYAYPPGYKIQGQVNPYDCSIQENFLSDRCKAQREALLAAEQAGNLPKTSACPTTLDAYLKAPFASQFDAACQKKWNDYAQDCSKQENFLTDRCKGPREALAKEQERQAQEKAAQEAAAKAAAVNASRNGGSNVTVPRGGGGGSTGTTGGNGLTPQETIFYLGIMKAEAQCKLRANQGFIWTSSGCIPPGPSGIPILNQPSGGGGTAWYVSCQLKGYVHNPSNKLQRKPKTVSNKFRIPTLLQAKSRCKQYLKDTESLPYTSGWVVSAIKTSKIN